MTTHFYTHPVFLEHDTGAGHPESPERLRAIDAALKRPEFSSLIRKESPRATLDQIHLVHAQKQIDKVAHFIPKEGIIYLDPDTPVSPFSLEAALHAAGAVCAAVDAVFAGEASNAFCGVRPPGHHATPETSMGFCLFNNVAIAAEHGRQRHGIRKVAIVDFDVHHGNGTQAAFEKNLEVLYASTHQYPWYPGSGAATETGVGNIFNAPLRSGAGSAEFRAAMRERILPAVDKFQPELVLVSAGFDAHRDDPLASLNLVEDDFAWITAELLALAKRHAQGRLVSTLEGGYELRALADSVAAHVGELLKA
ncbi:histone deacetylase family protein [Methylococcus sp. EFPC2]|uniref:histone deacetylase family protein n=1 Tax=Methylococcus sp. EFPC2 TaxID=2812648 RepID=UPI0019680DB6|nr:histone deacetylase family protein [Methylococcus sp. EFPC2]QSA97608.1 histone deacetylase family protein [Methylococcus sp. EFPC2]